MRESLRKVGYEKHGPCPECGERAVREQMSKLYGALDTYQCDACGEVFEEIDTDLNTDQPVWDGDPVEVERDSDAEPRLNLPGKTIAAVKGVYRRAKLARNEAKPDRSLTAREKSKSYLADACFVMGLMFSVTIIGIPFGLIFFVMAALVAPSFEDE